MSDLSPVPPEPHKFPIPSVNVPVGDLHTLLTDLGIQGVTRQGNKTWATFASDPPSRVRDEIMRRVKKP